MKMKQLVTTAAFLVAMTLAAPTAHALTAAQAKAVKKAVTSVAIPEMPAKAAELVMQASKADREGTAVAAVQAAVYKSRSSLLPVVAAVSKAAPDLAPMISQVAAEMERTQGANIARTAMISAPQSKSAITASVNRGVALAESHAVTASTPSAPSVTANAAIAPTVASTPTTPTFTPRQSAAIVTGGTVVTGNTPINGQTGGNGNGGFGGASANQAPAPTIVKYNVPRTP
jgi:hypothetical protein